MKKTAINVFFFFLFSLTVLGQGKLKGIVVDNEMNQPLTGVNLAVQGSAGGVMTDIDGKFEISVPASGKLAISFIGYQTKVLSFSVAKGEVQELGTIVLTVESNKLDEVVIKGSALFDIAKDRSTPVAVSTVNAAVIQQKLGNKEFVEILNNTPSVYASRGGGGFGDSRVTVRGFGQENIAIMINGMPVNDMENGRVFWSNWAGLSDVASAMQVQRGLGSSRLAISSVGGTINIVTKSSQRKEGGFVQSMLGNDDYRKFLATYSTGKMKNGFSASVLLSNTEGDGYVDGTKFSAQNYFLAMGYEFNKKHNIEFTFTGAPQWHHQRGTGITIQRYIQKGEGGEPNVRWNDDWGYYKGEEFNIRRNFYHKPVMSLNWEWEINSKTRVNTLAYGSWGRGGGSGAFGNVAGIAYTSDRLRDANGLVNYDLISQYNSGNAITIPDTNNPPGTVTLSRPQDPTYGNVNTSSSGLSMISGINSHNWYGAIMNVNRKFNKITVDAGVDYRYYKGIHVRNVNNLLGADYYRDQRNVNNNSFYTNQTFAASPSFNPFFNATKNTIVDRNWEGLVSWLGGFAQAEYKTDKLSVFVQGAVSNQSYQRVDYFIYADNDPLQTSDKQKRLGGNIKIGANYNLSENHNVFVNTGYYSRQPFIDAVFPNSRNLVNDDVLNEKILGIELGYGYRSAKFNANVNVYRTQWNDRFTSRADTDPANPSGYFVFRGVSELHQGVEVDFTYRPFKGLQVNGMFSKGDWSYIGTSTGDKFNNQNEIISTGTQVFLDGVKVGSAAQMTAALGFDYEFLPRFKFSANSNYFDNLYADINPANFGIQNNKGTLKLPSYTLFDTGLSYKMLVGKDNKDSVNFVLNVANVFDTIYILESQTNIFADDNVIPSNPAAGTYASNNKLYNGVADGNRVWFGFGRTWNFGITYNF